MKGNGERGMPGEFLLLFTLLLWALFLMVYLGNRKSKINKWCFICGMIFSVGVLKEYLYYSLFPQIMEFYPSVLDAPGALRIYSVLTAIPYYFATPALFITGLYFSRMEIRKPHLFPWITALSFAPGVILSIVYPITETRYYQLNDSVYYTIISVYNMIVALLATVLFLGTLAKEMNPKVKRQKLAITILALVPSWFAILTTIPVQLFGVADAEKAWQGNLLVILALVGLYVYLVFREGFMGSRFRHETYRWDEDEKLLGQTMDTVRHMLKNQVSKIEWCAGHIARRADGGELKEYTDIILRSTQRISDFMAAAREHGTELTCRPERTNVAEMLKSVAGDFEKRYEKVAFTLRSAPGSEIFCDRNLVREVLQNLFQNSVEAMGEAGQITAEFREAKGRYAVLRISDTGGGLSEEIKRRIFLPYASSKEGENHWGMGLYYCQKVMLSHGGRIEADNLPEGGAVFTLWFPRKKRKGIMRRHGAEKNTGTDSGR